MRRTAAPAISNPAIQRASVINPVASSCGHSVFQSTSARSVIQCHPVCATSAERMIIPTRPDITYRRSSASTGSIAASTAIWPSSIPMLNESSETTRWRPANWRFCCSPYENPNPWTSPKRPVISQRRRRSAPRMFSSAM